MSEDADPEARALGALRRALAGCARSNRRGVVELCTCHGEPVDELRSEDPELLRYLADRPTSEQAED